MFFVTRHQKPTQKLLSKGGLWQKFIVSLFIVYLSLKRNNQNKKMNTSKLSSLINRPKGNLLFKYSLRFFPIIALLMIPVASALADTITTKVALYNDVYWATFGTWITISVIGTIISAMIAWMLNAGCALAMLVVGIVVIGIGGAFVNSSSMATQASSTDWDAMVIEKATYVEILLGKWVRADRTHTPQDSAGNPITCHTNDLDSSTSNEAATGCRMATEDSYCARYETDDDGNTSCADTDYRYYNWFTHEITKSGDLDIYKNGHVIFADHCAPEDWQNHIAHLPNGYQPGVHFCVAQSTEWDRVNQAVNIDHVIMPGMVYNNTLNWVNADPETVFRGSTNLVPDYQARGLLPQVLPITNSLGQPFTKDIFGNTTGPLGYDYQVVQFLGSLNPDPAFQAQMQRQAALLAGYIGPKLKANIAVNFAFASEVPYPDQWMSTSKAYSMDNTVHASTPFKRTLAMNLAMFNCGVSDDQSTVLWCRMETGAFEDNVEMKVFVSTMQPFAFTPDSVFGTMSGGFVYDANGNLIMEDVDWDDRQIPLAKTEIVFSGGAINNIMFGLAKDQQLSAGIPFVKVPKETYQNKQYLISPDADQIQRIKDARSAETFRTIGFIMFIITVCIGGSVAKTLER